MKFFRNMDEMELHLSLNAIRVAWFFTVIALFIWGIWDCVHTGRFTAPMYLLIDRSSRSISKSTGPRRSCEPLPGTPGFWRPPSLGCGP